MHLNRHADGFTLIEMLLSMAIAAILAVGLGQLASQALQTKASLHPYAEQDAQIAYALKRISTVVTNSPDLILPFPDRPITSAAENIREQWKIGHPHYNNKTAILAVLMPRDWDFDRDGVPDADNDGDGYFDEDWPEDNDFGYGSGLFELDSDNDGTRSDSTWYLKDDDEDPIDGIDNDHDGWIDEDPPDDMNKDGQPGVANVDDDGDGQIDEGYPATKHEDDDEDGKRNEDWRDPVVYYLKNDVLMERTPVPWDTTLNGSVTGRDIIKRELLPNIIYFRVERHEEAMVQQELVSIRLDIERPDGTVHTVNRTVRVGGAL